MKTRSKFATTTAAVVVALTVGLVPASAADERAADAPASEQVELDLSAEAAAIARDTGVPVSEVEQALLNVDRIDATHRLARTLLGGAFAGFWTEPATARMSVAAAGGVPPAVQARLVAVSEGLDLTFVAAVHPLRDLEAVVRVLPDDLGWHQAGVDPVANAVALEAHPGRGAQVAVEVAARFPNIPFTVNESEPVELAQLVPDTCVSRRNCTPVARGGVEIFFGPETTGPRPVCSSGFTGVRDGAHVVYTAGHCQGANVRVSHAGVTWGTMLVSRFSGDTDGAVFSQVAPWQPSNMAYWNDNVKTHRITARRVTADQYVGEASCKLGRTTGNTCGTITAVNRDIIVGGTLLTGQTFTNACALPGDSGGSVLRTSTAQGIVSGARFHFDEAGGAVCPRQAADRLMSYTPIRRIEARVGGVVRTTAP